MYTRTKLIKLIKFYNRKIKQQKCAFEVYSALSVYDNIHSLVNLSYPTYV